MTDEQHQLKLVGHERKHPAKKIYTFCTQRVNSWGLEDPHYYYLMEGDLLGSEPGAEVEFSVATSLHQLAEIVGKAGSKGYRRVNEVPTLNREYADPNTILRSLPADKYTELEAELGEIEMGLNNQRDFPLKLTQEEAA